MNSKRIILEDILDDLSAQDIDRQSKDVVIEQDKFDAYLLFAAEQQKCGFLQGKLRWSEYDKDTEIDVQHEYLREHAVNYYKNTDDYRGIDFETAVVTNAVDYTSGAKELAKNNGVSLIARNELSKMLNDVHLPNIY